MNFADIAKSLWSGLGKSIRGFFGNARLAEKGPLPYTPQIEFSIPISVTGYSKMDPNPQEWTLNRMIFTNTSTQGELWFDNKFQFYTLEPTCRLHQKPLPEYVAVPAKRYQLNIQYSNKFGRMMPHLVDVPDREGILLHWGNFQNETQKDSEGCILLGLSKGVDYVGDSRAAFNELFPIIQDRTKDKLLFLTILGGISVNEQKVA